MTKANIASRIREFEELKPASTKLKFINKNYVIKNSYVPLE
jgi:hypothetical protein